MEKEWAVTINLQQRAEAWETLDSRYDDLKSGRMKPLDGEEALAELRRKSRGDPRRALEQSN
jgi:hypothetical protein